MAEPDHAQFPGNGLAVSVVVCTHDRERFLPGVLDSLARQTVAPAIYEIVIVDNGSTDGTARRFREFVERHPTVRARVVTEPQLGLSHARNRGMAEASGRVITYVDDDAIAMPELIGAVMAFFAAHPEAAAVGGRVLAEFEGERPPWYNRFSAGLFFSHTDRGDRSFRFRRFGGYPIGCNMSFRSDVLRETGGFDTSLGRRGREAIGGEEKALFARLIAGGLACWYDPRQVVRHRIDPQRAGPAYVRRLALGLGHTHRRMYCRAGPSLSCAWHLAITAAKLGVALALGLLYLMIGRPEVSRHLVAYRWLVLQGYLRGGRRAPMP